MAYQAAFFDLGGVVVEFDADRIVHQVAQLVGRPFDDVQRAVYDPGLLLPFELGQIAPEAYYEGLRARLNLTWTYARFVLAWNDIFVENRDVTRILERLRATHRLIALTNTNVLHFEHLRSTVPSLALFHGYVASCALGVRKPMPEMYQAALAHAGVPAEAALYVDDRPEMVEAGRKAGLTAIRFLNSRQLEQDLRAAGVDV